MVYKAIKDTFPACLTQFGSQFDSPLFLSCVLRILKHNSPNVSCFTSNLLYIQFTLLRKVLFPFFPDPFRFFKIQFRHFLQKIVPKSPICFKYTLYQYPFENIYSETQLILIYSKQTIIVKVLGCFKILNKGMQVSFKSY